MNNLLASLKGKLKKIDVKLNYLHEKGYMFVIKKSEMCNISLERLGTLIGDDLFQVNEVNYQKNKKLVTLNNI